MNEILHDRPREKLQKKGAASLTNAELLQILIGSGTAQANVVRIARKTLKQLTKYGNSISHDMLLSVNGLGVARAAQILAAFELASRYPISNRQLTIDTHDKAKGLFVELRIASTTKLVYLTLDGARRLIAKRSMRVNEETHPSELLREVFSHVVTDKAAGIMVGIGGKRHVLDPTMFELSLARDLNGMAQLFIVTVHDLLLVNDRSELSLKAEVW